MIWVNHCVPEKGTVLYDLNCRKMKSGNRFKPFIPLWLGSSVRPFNPTIVRFKLALVMQISAV